MMQKVKALYDKVAAYAVALVLGLSVAFWSVVAQAATVFPVDAASTATLTSLATDLVSWGVAILAVGLTIYAIRKVFGLIGVRR